MDIPQGTSSRAVDCRGAPLRPTIAPAEGLSNRPQFGQSQQTSGAYTGMYRGASERATSNDLHALIGLANQGDVDRRGASCGRESRRYVSARGHPSEHRSAGAHFGGRYQNAGGPRFPSGFVSGSVPRGPIGAPRYLCRCNGRTHPIIWSSGRPLVTPIASPTSINTSQGRIFDVVRGQGQRYASVRGPRIPHRPVEVQGITMPVLLRPSLVYGVRPMTFPGDSPQFRIFAPIPVYGELPLVRIGERYDYNHGGRGVRREDE